MKPFIDHNFVNSATKVAVKTDIKHRSILLKSEIFIHFKIYTFLKKVGKLVTTGPTI
jgi:hypothetical protein